jgi:hypothetical protein
MLSPAGNQPLRRSAHPPVTRGNPPGAQVNGLRACPRRSRRGRALSSISSAARGRPGRWPGGAKRRVSVRPSPRSTPGCCGVSEPVVNYEMFDTPWGAASSETVSRGVSSEASTSCRNTGLDIGACAIIKGTAQPSKGVSLVHGRASFRSGADRLTSRAPRRLPADHRRPHAMRAPLERGPRRRSSARRSHHERQHHRERPRRRPHRPRPRHLCAGRGRRCRGGGTHFTRSLAPPPCACHPRPPPAHHAAGSSVGAPATSLAGRPGARPLLPTADPAPPRGQML